MEIVYLQALKDYNYAIYRPGGPKIFNEGYSINEIEQIELELNNGNKFPKAVRELLFLGGKKCNILDNARGDGILNLHLRYNSHFGNALSLHTSRPYLIISDDPQASGNFDIAYLDEGDNPMVVGVEPTFSDHNNISGTTEIHEIYDLGILSSYVSKGIDWIKDENETTFNYNENE